MSLRKSRRGSDRVKKWNSLGRNISDRFRLILKDNVSRGDASPEERIGDLPIRLDIDSVEEALADACQRSNITVVFVIDRLDEGYELDEKGIGFVDGLVQATIDLKTRIPRIRPLVFLRDNMFRAVQVLDPDYSRNIEGHILRLHWDDDTLFHFAAKRLKLAFNLSEEKSQRIWNRCVAGDDLKGKPGFDKCLHLTLYRPRDLLSLLNESFFLASKAQQFILALDHVQLAGKTISENRLEDLKKEYVTILPGLSEYIASFLNQKPELNVEEVIERLESRLSNGSDDPVVQQEMFILEDANAVLRGLYSVGFLGVKHSSTGAYVFCHDGRAPDRKFTTIDRVLIHPCYWIALNCSKSTLDPNNAEQIYDEYDIEVSSETPEVRNTKIKELIQQLNGIETGHEGATDFETWCHKALRICFAKGLRNVELKPNKKVNRSEFTGGSNS